MQLFWTIAPTRVPIIAVWQTSDQCLLYDTGEYIRRRQRKRTQSRMCSFVYLNLQLLAAIPTKDWVKKNLFLVNVDKVDEYIWKKKKKLFKVLFRFFHHMIYQKIINKYFSFHPMYLSPSHNDINKSRTQGSVTIVNFLTALLGRSAFCIQVSQHDQMYKLWIKYEA